MIKRWVDDSGCEIALVSGYNFEKLQKEIDSLKKEGFGRESLVATEMGTTYEEHSLVRHIEKKEEESIKGIGYFTGSNHGQQT